MEKARKFFLKEWREHRGMTQQQLADATGRTKGYISNIERGENRYNEDLLEELAAALECESWELLGKDPSKPAKADSSLALLWEHVPEDNKPQVMEIVKTFAKPQRKKG